MSAPQVSKTRPANTTAYTAGDVIGSADTVTAANAGDAVWEFPSAAQVGGLFFITSVMLQIGAASIPSGMTSFRLHLFDRPPDASLDNAAFALSSANDQAAYLGFIDLAPIVVGSVLFAQADAVNLQRKLATGVTSLYGELVTTGGFTPASGTVFRLTVNTLPV